MAEAIKLLDEFEDAKAQIKEMIGCKSLQSICNLVDGKYQTSFLQTISRTSLRRYSKCGVTTVRPREHKPNISKTLVMAGNLYSSMIQVFGNREVKPRQLKTIVNATIKDTYHEEKSSKNYAYTKVLATNATTMEASCGRTNEDIRGQWTTYKKTHIWFKTTKDDLLKLGLSIDKPVFNNDNVIIEDVLIPDDCKARLINFDETDYPLSNEDDKGGPRDRTYTDPNLPRPGGNSTRGSRHTT